jgi:hypothetical protein
MSEAMTTIAEMAIERECSGRHFVFGSGARLELPLQQRSVHTASDRLTNKRWLWESLPLRLTGPAPTPFRAVRASKSLNSMPPPSSLIVGFETGVECGDLESVLVAPSIGEDDVSAR